MRNKSLFERLFEEAMSDEESLGLPPVDDSQSVEAEVSEDESGFDDSDDSVTITIDRKTAHMLHDLLGSVIGETDESEDAEEVQEVELDAEVETDLGESTEAEEVKEDAGTTKKKNVVGSLKPTGGKAEVDTTKPSGWKPLTGAIKDGKGASNKVGDVTKGAFPKA